MHRRDLLRGLAGTALGAGLLPRRGRAQSTGPAPRRIVFVFTPEGMQPDYWWPTAVGSPTDFRLGPSLQPLERHRDQLCLLRGIDHRSPQNIDACAHDIVMPHILTGGPVAPGVAHNGISTPAGMSIDRVLAQHIQGPAPFASYHFGVTAAQGREEIRQLSFDGTGQPREAQDNPYAAFLDLFNGERPAPTDGTETDDAAAAEQTRRLRILDLVRAQSEALPCGADARLRDKFTAHADATDVLRTQWRQQEARARSVTIDPVSIAPEWNDSGRHLAEANYPEVGRMQMDLLVSGLAYDLFRVGVLQWSTTVSGVSFPWLADQMNFPNTQHHAAGHSQSIYDVPEAEIPARMEDVHRMTSWYMEQFAYLLDRMKAVPEGDGTLLDHTTVVAFSEFSFSNFHDMTNLPILIAGGGGALRTGRYLDLRGSGGRDFADVLLTAAHATGVTLPRFGAPDTAQGIIPELLT